MPKITVQLSETQANRLDSMCDLYKKPARHLLGELVDGCFEALVEEMANAISDDAKEKACDAATPAET